MILQTIEVNTISSYHYLTFYSGPGLDFLNKSALRHSRWSNVPMKYCTSFTGWDASTATPVYLSQTNFGFDKISLWTNVNKSALESMNLYKQLLRHHQIKKKEILFLSVLYKFFGASPGQCLRCPMSNLMCFLRISLFLASASFLHWLEVKLVSIEDLNLLISKTGTEAL